MTTTPRRHSVPPLTNGGPAASPDAARAGERGAALLATVLIGAALASATAILATSVRNSAQELRARSEVLCARYAAAGALAAGPGADRHPELISPQVGQLEVRALARGRSWCVLRATAHCGDAVRSAERSVDCGG